jgi:SAM-dependent methyltransferase
MPMETKTVPNAEQAALWNGSAGLAWVAEQALLDTTFARFEELLVARVEAAGASRVLDVGCGAGATTLAIARRLGAGGACVGVDISEPLIQVARARAARETAAASFIVADAQTARFEPASFDLIVSRFGVMFFEDPVAAFVNLRRALRDGGRIDCIAFRAAAENPFMTTAERAAGTLLPNVPPRQPDAPGQFAFANRERVQRILGESGWTAIDLAPVDVPCAFPEQELVGYFTRLGPVGHALTGADEATRQRVIEKVRAAFVPFVRGSEVRFDAACWLISARAG